MIKKFLILIVAVFLVLVFIGKIKNGKESQNLIPEGDGTKINTLGWEDTPFVSLDGNKLFFTYSPHDYLSAVKSKFKKIEIRGPIREGHTINEYITKPQVLVVHNYVAEKKSDGIFSSPKPIHFEGDDGDRVGGSMWVSENGKAMFLAGWKFAGSKRVNYGSGDIYISSNKGENNWSEPQNMGISINTEYLEDNPHFVETSQTLYFDSDRPGSFGQWDIYYSVKGNNKWSEPINMGSVINTSDTEGMAYFNKQGNRMYFIRGGAKTGLTKLYVSEFSGNQWSNPKLIDLGIEDVSSPSLAGDEKTLYVLYADRKINKIDIYYSTKNSDGSWSKAQPVD